MANFFLFLILIIISKINLYNYFQVNQLISGNIFLITDESIILQNKDTNQNQSLYSLDINGIEQPFLNIISFAEYYYNDEEYIICRFKNTIYILYKENTQIAIINDENINEHYCKIIPYKLTNNHLTFIITYINSDNKFNLIVYEIDKNSGNYTLLKNKVFNNSYVKDAISCDYMNNALVCFLSELDTNNLISISINLEDDYKEDILSKFQKSYSIEIIKSIVSQDKKVSLVCYIDTSFNYKCSLFNVEKKVWSNEIALIYYSQKSNYETNIIYISDTSEYILYAYSTPQKIEFLIFDESFKIISKNHQNYTCFISKEFSNCEQIISSLFYDTKSGNYTLMAKCTNLTDYYILNIERDCDSYFPLEDFIFQISLSTTIFLTQTTILTNYLTTIPLTTISVTTNPFTTNPFTTNPFTTIPLTIIPLTTIPLTTIPLTTIPVTTNHFTTIPLTTIPLKTIPLTTIQLTTIPLTTIPLTTIQLTTIPLTTIPLTTIPLKTISSLLSSFLSLPSSTEISQKIPNSTILYSLDLPSIASSISLNYIDFYDEGNIIKGKINITKKEAEKNIKQIMEIIQINQKYKLYGEDFNLTISPINDINSFNSTYVELNECEEILRGQYELSSEEILIILQIEIDKMNKKSLVNQIEYAIYNEQKEQLNLD